MSQYDRGHDRNPDRSPDRGYGSDRGGRGGYRDDRGGGRGGRGGRGGDSRSDRGGDFDDRPRRGTPLSELDPALTEVSRKVIGCAIEVHMELGPGYDESVYAKALQLEMQDQGVPFKIGHSFPVLYGDDEVGRVAADLWVNDRFIVEVMARPGEIGSYERSALRAQLRAADVELGLIINFGERRLKDGLVRVLNPDKLNELKGDADPHAADDFDDAHDADEPGEPKAP
jgi:GxxExxY protein